MFAVAAGRTRRDRYDRVAMAAPIPLTLLSDSASIKDDGRLAVAGCDVGDLVEQFGSPLFIYDEEHLRARCRTAADAFDGNESAMAAKRAARPLERPLTAIGDGSRMDFGSILSTSWRPWESLPARGRDASVARASCSTSKWLSEVFQIQVPLGR